METGCVMIVPGSWLDICEVEERHELDEEKVGDERVLICAFFGVLGNESVIDGVLATGVLEPIGIVEML
jgi:hypothetical protein